uniref:Uncharacterized protein n=1 Tax=Anguilla anguilla TaxID=7936 RepID=A0A0E9X6B0_ANGAN
MKKSLVQSLMVNLVVYLRSQKMSCVFVRVLLLFYCAGSCPPGSIIVCCGAAGRSVICSHKVERFGVTVLPITLWDF